MILALFEEAVALERTGSEPGLAAYFVISLGALAAERGDLERARVLFEEALAQARRAGADMVVGDVLLEEVNMARRSGDLARAERLGREQLLVFHRQGTRHLLASNLEALACTAAAAADDVRAARLLGAAAALRERIGIQPRRLWRVQTERAMAAPRAKLGEGRWAAAFAAGQALSHEQAVAEALGTDEVDMPSWRQ